MISVTHVERVKVNQVPVYDISVNEVTPCFSLEAGVISHNTVPWSSELMDLRCSRFKDGLNLHYDYSANEIRVLAKVANETALLKAFEEGKDIHRYIAAKASRKSEDQVTDAERRFSKMRSFCLHPDTEVLIHGKYVKICKMQNYIGRKIYSTDELGRIKIDRVKRAKPTITTSKALRITYSAEGKILGSTEVTSNHEFRLNDGRYVAAGLLHVGDILMGCDYRIQRVNITVHSIVEVQYIDPIQFWDIETAELHNFPIRASSDYNVFVHNSIMYGKGTRAFGLEFMAGDIPAAEKLYDDFFTEFPGVRVYIQDRHREALSTGQVTTLFGNPINVDMPDEGLILPDSVKELIIFEPEGIHSDKVVLCNDRNKNKSLKAKIGSALRNAQNYGIQGLASQLAAISADQLNESFKRKSLTDKVTCFTHDSLDIDHQIINLPYTLRELPRYAVDYPKEKFGIPLAIDYALGVSCDQLVELHNTTVDATYIKTGFSGKRTSLDKLIARLEEYGVKTSMTIHKEKSKLQSLEELFISRRAYALSFGSTYVEVEGTLELDFTNVRSAY